MVAAIIDNLPGVWRGRAARNEGIVARCRASGRVDTQCEIEWELAVADSEPSDKRAQIDLSWRHRRERRLVVEGEDGVLEWLDGEPPFLRRRGGLATEILSFGDGEPLALEVEHFLQCLSSGVAPLTSGLASLFVLERIDEARASLALSVCARCYEGGCALGFIDTCDGSAGLAMFCA